MPLYEYQCGACSHRFEKIQKFSDPPLEACPKCGGAVRKLPSSPAIQFKGSGFYKTDYPTKSSTESTHGSGSTDKADKADKADKTATSADTSAKADAGTKSTDTKSTDTTPAKPTTKNE